MFLRTETIPTKKLIGLNIQTSLAKNQTAELWRKFMPRRKEITNAMSNDLFSLQVYPAHHNHSDVQAKFTKWALCEVSDFDPIPEDMKTFVLPAGKYAVFLHQGPASEGYRTFQYIFETWLPNNSYALADRPHFEILGEKYKNNAAESEEEIWIPID